VKYDCPTEVTLAPIWPYVGGVTCHLFGVASTVTTILGGDGHARFPVQPPARREIWGSSGSPE